MLRDYYSPMIKYIDSNLPDEINQKVLISLIGKWSNMKLLETLIDYTEKMETKVYNLEKLISDVEGMGFRVQRTPETVFVSYTMEEGDLPEELVILRNTYGFMIQTEIQWKEKIFSRG